MSGSPSSRLNRGVRSYAWTSEGFLQPIFSRNWFSVFLSLVWLHLITIDYVLHKCPNSLSFWATSWSWQSPPDIVLIELINFHQLERTRTSDLAFRYVVLSAFLLYFCVWTFFQRMQVCVLGGSQCLLPSMYLLVRPKRPIHPSRHIKATRK